MTVQYLDTPFEHILLNQILTDEENDVLYSDLYNNFYSENKKEIDDKSFFLRSSKKYLLEEKTPEEILSQSFTSNENFYDLAITIFNDNINENSRKVLYKVENFLNELELNKLYKIQEKGKWSVSINISVNLEKESYYFKLSPHTDDPVFLKRELNRLTPGYIKGVIYVGDRKIKYPNYGTRFYENIKTESEIKEIPFIPGNGFIFKPGPSSWHGTDYKDTDPQIRFTILMEYIQLQQDLI